MGLQLAVPLLQGQLDDEPLAFMLACPIDMALRIASWKACHSAIARIGLFKRKSF
jgi:hypothetical protein